MPVNPLLIAAGVDPAGAMSANPPMYRVGDGPIPPETAYRLIQESLTNTAKYAAGTSASILLAFRPGALALAVEDDGPPPGGSGAGLAAGSGAGSRIGDEGHGIIGMRERAAALGGWLTAGPRADGGFRVLAELPAPVGATP